MPKYTVTGTVTVSAYTTVIADSPEQAIEIAKGREPILCPFGTSVSGANEAEEAIVEEADGAFFPENATEAD